MDLFFLVVVILLLLSLAGNVLLTLYIKHVMKRSSLVVNVTNDMLGALEDISTLLENVHELPLFYGDETLKGLLEHSKFIVEDMKSYRDGFDFGGVEGDGTTTEETTPEED